MILPILISVSVAPVSYFFCAYAVDGAAIDPVKAMQASVSARRTLKSCMISRPPFGLINRIACLRRLE